MRSVFRIIALIALAFPLYAQEKPSEESPEDAASAEFAEIVAFINRPTNTYNFTWRAGAISRYLRDHTQHLQALLSRVTLRNYAERNVVALALWLADTPEATELLKLYAEYNPLLSAPPLMGAAVSLEAPRPDVTQLEKLYNGVEESNVLDIAWGMYDVTGDEQILGSFIRCAARRSAPSEGAYVYWCISPNGRQQPPSGAEGLDIVAMAAKWSVQSRAEQDASFAAEVERVLLLQSPEVQAGFREPLPNHEQNKRRYSAE